MPKRRRREAPGDDLGIEGSVKRLEAINEEFSHEHEKSKTKKIAFCELEAARNRGNLFFRHIIVKTMGEYNRESEEDNVRRAVVLSPVPEQVERSRQRRPGDGWLRRLLLIMVTGLRN